MAKKDYVTIAVPAEDVEYVESIRIYNVKVPKEWILSRIKIIDD